MADSKVTVLGAGPSGLALAYYAQKQGLNYELYDHAERVGGNAVTLNLGKFYFDSGAHRFHDKDDEATQEIKNIMGDSIREINVPTQTYLRGKLIDFPLSPFNLIKNLGIVTISRAIVEIFIEQLKPYDKNNNFETFALKTYGRTIASLMLLNYTERLWGLPCHELSPVTAGKRLKGLNFMTLLLETVLGQKKKTRHLEGANFFYPKFGIGSIAERLCEIVGPEKIKLGSRVTKIIACDKKITSIEINGNNKISIDYLVNTLPIDYFLNIMVPRPPEEVLNIANSLKYRDMILVIVTLKKASVVKSATVYFPDSRFIFTRVYEPKNRSPQMSPEEQTSLVAEIPCQKVEPVWQENDADIVQKVVNQFIEIGWIEGKDVLTSTVYRMEYAYPILELHSEKKVDALNNYLSQFGNLFSSGRNGRFEYSWIHNMMVYGRQIIQRIYDQESA